MIRVCAAFPFSSQRSPRSSLSRWLAASSPMILGGSRPCAQWLPARLRELSAAAGDARETSAVALPDYSLEDHWQHGDASRAIGRGGWTFVVLQQGPSALPESRVLLVDYSRRFDAQVRAAAAARRSTWCGRPIAGVATCRESAPRMRRRRSAVCCCDDGTTACPEYPTNHAVLPGSLLRVSVAAPVMRFPQLPPPMEEHATARRHHGRDACADDEDEPHAQMVGQVA